MKKIVLLLLISLNVSSISLASEAERANLALQQTIQAETEHLASVEAELFKMKTELNNLKLNLIEAQADPKYKELKFDINLAYLPLALSGAYLGKQVMRFVTKTYITDITAFKAFVGLVASGISATNLAIALSRLSYSDAARLQEQIEVRIEKIEGYEKIANEKRRLITTFLKK